MIPAQPGSIAAPLRPDIGFSRARRLRTPAEFAALRDGDPRLRAGRRWLVIAAARRAPDAGPGADVGAMTAPAAQVRFGVTVGKRNARLSVQRNLVKRILREAMRHAAPALERAAAGSQVDVVMRLKAPFPAAAAMSLVRFKPALRAEADGLLATLRGRLAEGAGLPDPRGAQRDGAAPAGRTIPR